MTREEQIVKAAKDAEKQMGFGEGVPSSYGIGFLEGAVWADEHPKPLWKDAHGEDLPPIDKEVIVIDKQGRVSYGHRPSPDEYITYEYEKIYVKTYGKGGWNISDIVWWLDLELPSMEEQQ